MSQKKQRGKGFSTTEVESLLESIEEVLPIGQNEWDSVVSKHYCFYPDMNHDRASLDRKFKSLYNHKKPTGDPTCPPSVRKAKQLERSICEKMDFSECESGVEFSNSTSIGNTEEDDAQEEETGEDDECNISSPVNSSMIESVSSVESSEKKRRIESILIRNKSRRWGNENDDTLKTYMEFMMMKHEKDEEARRQWEEKREQDRKDLEERRESERKEWELRRDEQRRDEQRRDDNRQRRHDEMMTMMMTMIMKSNASSNSKSTDSNNDNNNNE